MDPDHDIEYLNHADEKHWEIVFVDTGEETLKGGRIKRVEKWRVPTEFIDFKWFASPLSRAQKTASILGLSVETEPAIIEMDWGKWEGQTGPELREKYGEEFIRRQKRGIDLRPDGGESPRDVRARVGEWVVSVAEKGVPTGAVAHQGIIRAMVSLATGWNMINPPPKNTPHSIIAPGTF